jgi:hypothetical protein
MQLSKVMTATLSVKFCIASSIVTTTIGTIILYRITSLFSTFYLASDRQKRNKVRQIPAMHTKDGEHKSSTVQ